MNILIVNAGSSSLKYQVINTDDGSVVAKGLCERIGIEGSSLTYKPTGKDSKVVKQDMKDHTDAVKLVLDALLDPETGVIKDISEIDAVGHRMVHGGEKFTEACLITDEAIATIEEMVDLAPLHTPANLMGIRACKAVMKDTPMVGVFDTAFHQTMPAEAYLYALPYEAYTDLQIRRYGFHGTSHKYVSQRAIDMLGKPAEETKIITCHLGNGSSITAIKGGKSIDTSMGFTPLEGVPMGTRCGDMDPAIVTYLMDKKGFTTAQVNAYMNKQSGVFGVSGVSSDFRDLEEAASAGNERAKTALDTFVYKVKKYVGAYAAALDGVDAIVFTAGIGENDRGVREEVLKGLGYLGVEVDFEYNKTCARGEEVELSTPNSRVKVYVIPTDEEMMIARDTARVVSTQK